MKGIISALVMPFTCDGQVDEEKLKTVIDYNINISQVDGLYINGSTGENFMLDTQTKMDIFKLVSDYVDGRVPLIAQVGSINLKEAIALGQYVKSLGTYQALSAITPFYYKFNFEEIMNYYQQIITSCDMDMIIYNIPSFTGVAVSIEQFSQLFANERIIGVKFTASDFYTMERIKQLFPNKLLYSGFDECLLPAVAVGIDGAIGSTYNFQAFLAKDVIKDVERGDLNQARISQAKMNTAIDILLANGLYQTIKAVLTVDGADGGFCQAPMQVVNDNHLQAAKQILAIIKDKE